MGSSLRGERAPSGTSPTGRRRRELLRACSTVGQPGAQRFKEGPPPYEFFLRWADPLGDHDCDGHIHVGPVAV